MTLSSMRSVSVRNSFRRAFRSVRVSFGAHFVSPYIVTSASKQASNYSEEPHLVCVVPPAALRVVVIVVVDMV